MYPYHTLDIILMSGNKTTAGLSYLSLNGRGGDLLHEVQGHVSFLKPGTQVILSLQTYPGAGKSMYRSRWDYTVPDV